MIPRAAASVLHAQRSAPGHFLIVSASGEDYETAEGESGRVKFMVEHVLSKDQVRHLVERDLWCASGSEPRAAPPAPTLSRRRPSGFRSLVDHRGHAMAARSAAGAAEGSGEHAGGGGDADSDSSGADDLLFHNRNRELPSDSSDDEGG